MEEELVEQPNSNEEAFDDDDFFADVDNEVIEEQGSQEEPTEEESSEPSENQEEGEKEIDFKPLLDYLSKNVKYNKESINVDNIEDVINNFQKGLNYDKLQSKYNDLSNGKAMSFISKKAQDLGITVDEYMDQVEAYEKEQQEKEDQKNLEDMMNNGVPEELAREVIATAELRRQLQAEKNELEKQKQEREEQNKKDAEYNNFIEEFPNVKAEDIPKDVFLNAQEKNISLTQAYKDYLYEETKKELEIMKQNQANSTRTVGSTQGFGNGQENVASDPFLDGFNS